MGLIGLSAVDMESAQAAVEEGLTIQHHPAPSAGCDEVFSQ